jgi:phosphohistidine phosphatase
MILYVMRHAEAVEGSETLPDEWRFLTEKGRATTEKMSSLIGKYGPKPRLTITSPLTRAVQTAEIVAQKACRRNTVVANVLLALDGDINELVTFLKGLKDDARVMLVGHEPQLGSLVATLLGSADKPMPLKKGSCVALQLKSGRKSKPAEFLWYLIPGKKCFRSLDKAFPLE